MDTTLSHAVARCRDDSRVLLANQSNVSPSAPFVYSDCELMRSAVVESSRTQWIGNNLISINDYRNTHTHTQY